MVRCRYDADGLKQVEQSRSSQTTVVWDARTIWECYTMALSKSYYTVGGEILGERTPIGGRVNYGVDALGSVTSTLVGDAVQNRYAYKPYGSELSRSGAGSDPSFRWVGSQGYRP